MDELCEVSDLLLNTAATIHEMCNKEATLTIADKLYIETQVNVMRDILSKIISIEYHEKKVGLSTRDVRLIDGLAAERRSFI